MVLSIELNIRKLCITQGFTLGVKSLQCFKGKLHIPGLTSLEIIILIPTDNSEETPRRRHGNARLCSPKPVVLSSPLS